MLTKTKERAEEAPPRDQALGVSEANFRNLAETIASGIFVSQGKRLHYVNHAAEVITGYTRDELLTMNFRDRAIRRMAKRSRPCCEPQTANCTE